jgi:hypothetical protein
MSSPASYAITGYEVILLSAGTEPKRVAKAIVANTDLRRAEALELIQAAPVTIIEGAGSATAEGAREALESAGATVEVRAYGQEAPLPAPSAGWKGWQVALVILGILIVVALLLLMSFIQSMNDFFSM